MKITNPEVIKNGESDLIDAITADMDWVAIEEVFGEKHKLNIDDNVEYKKGDIVVYNNQIAYKLEFDVKVNLSILLDRNGNYISVSTSLDPDNAEVENEKSLSDEPGQDDDERGSGSEEALSEPDIHEPPEDINMGSTASDDKSSQEKISELAATAGEIMEQIEDEK